MTVADIVNVLSAAVAALASLAAGLSTFVKVSWIVLIVWAIAQVGSYWLLRIKAPLLSAAPRKAARRRPAKKQAAAPVASDPPEVVSDLGMSVHVSTAAADTYR